jgi:dihydroorotase
MLSKNQIKKVLVFLHNIGLTNVTEEDILFIAKNFVDMHGHGRRDGELPFTMMYEIAQFAAMFFMPNVQVDEVGEKEMGIFTFEKLLWYRDHVLLECKGKPFTPLFSYYLTTKLSVEDIIKAWEQKLISGIKYYPKGGTTNSENGLSGFEAVRPQLECMARLKIPFNIHGEIPTLDGENPVKGAEREGLFYTTEAKELLKWYDGPVVAEHITTDTAVRFVKQYDNVIGTITPQHLLLNDMAIFHKVKAANDCISTRFSLAYFPA